MKREAVLNYIKTEVKKKKDIVPSERSLSERVYTLSLIIRSEGKKAEL